MIGFMVQQEIWEDGANKMITKKEMSKLTTTQLQKVMVMSREIVGARNQDIKTKKLKKFVGKYFKFRNNYSCPQLPEDYWWEYLYVKKIENGELIVSEISKDSKGIISIEMNKWSMFLNWIECSKEEFNEFFNTILAEITIGREISI